MRDMQLRRRNTNIWNIVINFFNRGRPLKTRSELIDELNSRGFSGNHNTTMDTYRNYLDKAGYLRTVRRGVYESINEIPVDLSVQDCRSEAYEKPTPFIKGKFPILRMGRIGVNPYRKKEFFSEGDFEI